MPVITSVSYVVADNLCTMIEMLDYLYFGIEGLLDKSLVLRH
jgi:hypothetical protein